MTIFEKILNKEIPCTVEFENENVLAFKDINPQAEIHILFIHKEKTIDLGNMMSQNPSHCMDLMRAITQYVKTKNITGYRVVTNIGASGGQSVFYTHFHLLADSNGLGGFGK